MTTNLHSGLSLDKIPFDKNQEGMGRDSALNSEKTTNKNINEEDKHSESPWVLRSVIYFILLIAVGIIVSVMISAGFVTIKSNRPFDNDGIEVLKMTDRTLYMIRDLSDSPTSLSSTDEDIYIYLTFVDNNSTNTTGNYTGYMLLSLRAGTLLEIASYFQLVFSSLSFFFCLIVLVVFIGLSELRGRQNFNLIMAFTTVEMLSCIRHFLILFAFFYEDKLKAMQSFFAVCTASFVFEYIFNFASYCYGFCIVLDLLNVIRNPIKNTKKQHIMFHMFVATLVSMSLIGFTTELVHEKSQECVFQPDPFWTTYPVYGLNGVMAIIGIGVCIYVWTSLRKGLPGTQQLRNRIIIRQCIFSVVIAASFLITVPSLVLYRALVHDIVGNESFAVEKLTEDNFTIFIFALAFRYIALLFSSIEGLILASILLSDPIVIKHLKRLKDFLLMLTENEQGVNIYERLKPGPRSKISSKNMYLSMLDVVDDDYELMSRRKLHMDQVKESIYHQRLLFEGIMDEGEAEQELFLKYLYRQDAKVFEDSFTNVAIDYMVRRDLIFCLLLGTQHCMKQSPKYDEIIRHLSHAERDVTAHKNSTYGSPLMKQLFDAEYRSVVHKDLYNCLTQHKITVTEYFPLAFHHLRCYYFVDNLSGNGNLQDIVECYKRSFEPTSVILESVRNNFSEGKSGSFFMFTYDSQFMVKTINDEELELLLNNAPFFYRHYTTFRDTLIYRIFGIYELKMTANFKIKFIVINNALNSRLVKDRGRKYDPVSITTKFDLKGSWINRNNLPKEDGYLQTLKKQKIPDGQKLLLDNDFNRKRKLVLEDSEIYKRLSQQITIDSNFLKSLNIMDYSLLIGMAEDDPSVIIEEPLPTEITFYEPFFKRFKGGIEAVDVDVVYNRAIVLFVSIIDILQTYNMKKKIETFAKTKLLRRDGKGISSLEPVQYAERFQTNILSKFTSRLDFYKKDTSSTNAISLEYYVRSMSDHERKNGDHVEIIEEQ